MPETLAAVAILVAWAVAIPALLVAAAVLPIIGQRQGWRWVLFLQRHTREVLLLVGGVQVVAGGLQLCVARDTRFAVPAALSLLAGLCLIVLGRRYAVATRPRPGP